MYIYAFEHCPQMYTWAATTADLLKMPVDDCGEKSFKDLPDSNLTTKKEKIITAAVLTCFY